MGNYIKTHLGQSMPQAGKGLAIAVNGSGSLWSQGKLITSQITNSLGTSSHATSDGVNLYIPIINTGKLNKILTLTGTATETPASSALQLHSGGYAVAGNTYYLIGVTGALGKLGVSYNFKTNTWTSLDAEITDYIGSAVIPKDDTDLYIYSGAERNNNENSPNILYKYEISSGVLTQIDQFEGKSYDSAFNTGLYYQGKLYIESYKGLFIYDLSTKTSFITSSVKGLSNGTNYFVDGTTVYKGGNSSAAALSKWSIDPLEVTELSKTPKGGCAVLVKDSGWLYSIPFTDEDSNLVYLDLSQHSWQPIFSPQNKKVNTFGPTVLEDTIVSKAAQVLKFSIEHTYSDQREGYYYELSVIPESASIQNHQYKNDDYLESYEVSIPENTTDQSREFIVTGIFKRVDNNVYEEDSKFTQKIIQLPY